MVTGGQMPGIAQLAVTASTRSAPESLSNTRTSPVCASTATTARLRDGQECRGSRPAITCPRSASGTVSDRERPVTDLTAQLGRIGVLQRQLLPRFHQLDDPPDVRGQLRGLQRGHGLPLEQVRQPQPAAELGGHRGPGRGAQHVVRRGDVGAGRGQPGQHAGFPGDPGQPAAAEDEGPLRAGPCSAITRKPPALQGQPVFARVSQKNPHPTAHPGLTAQARLPVWVTLIG